MKFRFIIYLLLLLSAPAPAEANIGVPMLFVTFPWMLTALIPIVFAEAGYLYWRLGTEFWELCRISGIANAVSTVVGIPITWSLLVLISFAFGGSHGRPMETWKDKFLSVTLYSPWLLPLGNRLHWMIPAAALFLLIPFFFASWLIEYYTAGFLSKEISRDILYHEVFYANLISYGVLFILMGSLLTANLTFRKIPPGNPYNDLDEMRREDESDSSKQ